MFLYSHTVFYVCKNLCTFIPLVMFQDSKTKFDFMLNSSNVKFCVLLLGFPGVSPRGGMRVFPQCTASHYFHNYDFQRTFGEKLLKYIAILARFISFSRRYVFIFVLFKTLIKLFLTCLVQELLFSYANYVL